MFQGELVGPIWEMTFIPSRLEHFAEGYWKSLDTNIVKWRKRQRERSERKRDLEQLASADGY